MLVSLKALGLLNVVLGALALLVVELSVAVYAVVKLRRKK